MASQGDPLTYYAKFRDIDPATLEYNDLLFSTLDVTVDAKHRMAEKDRALCRFCCRSFRRTAPNIACHLDPDWSTKNPHLHRQATLCKPEREYVERYAEVLKNMNRLHKLHLVAAAAKKRKHDDGSTVDLTED